MTLGITAALVLLVIWVGYPAALGVASWIRRPRRLGDPVQFPRVTAIVATREPPGVVAERVADLLRGDYPPERLDVIVAVDARHAQGYDLHPPADRCRVIVGDAPGGKATALNAAVRVATGDVLVFTDAHQRFASGTIRALVAAVGDPAVAGVSGLLKLPRPSAASPVYWYRRYEAWVREHEAMVASVIGVTGAVWAMRRTLWSPLPEGLILDDVFTPMRMVLAGHRVVVRTDAVAFETRATTDTQEYHRKVRTLTGVWQLCAWLPGVLSPLRNPVWLQFVFHKLLRLLTPYLVLASVLGFVFAGGQRLSNESLRVVLATIAIATLILATPTRLASRLRSMLLSAILLQAAVVTSTYNGVRGKWDVWRG